MKRIVGVIPSRWGSTRFPGKSLVSIGGKTLIERVVEQARKCRELAETIVATDDLRIVEAVSALGVRAVMTRPDHPSGTDRIAEAIATVQADVVVNIQGDEPLIDPKLIGAVGRALAGDGGWEMATAACPITDVDDVRNPSVVKVVCGADGRALMFSRAAIPHVRDGTIEEGVRKGLYWRHIGIYGYRREFLMRLVKTPPCALEEAEKLEQLRALWIGCRMRVLPASDVGVGVDTPEDVARIEALLRDRA